MKSNQEILFDLKEALKNRAFFSFYPEHHKAYPEEWLKNGEQKFSKNLGKYFKALSFGKEVTWIGEEVSPITLVPLNIKYPASSAASLVKTASSYQKTLKQLTPIQRADFCIDALQRIKERFFEIAHATTHTTGQSFLMAFQASGPHAADRALETIGMAYQELTRYNSNVTWEKPMGKSSVILQKEFKPIPKGIGVVIGCSTFPVWNSVPGIFANLMCGNPVIVKPHPKAILPIAIVIEEIQNALIAARLPENLIQLAPDTLGNPITKQLCEKPLVKVIDYTGSTSFGNYIEGLSGKETFTEKSAINSVIIDSSNNLKESLQNLAFSMLLYSGQMCTSPQNIFIGEKGVKTPERTVSYPEVLDLLKQEINSLIEHPQIGVGTMANIQSNKTIETIKNSINLKETKVLNAKPIENSKGQTSTPLIIETNSKNKNLIFEEHFGPIFKIVKTISIDESLSLAKQNAAENGAITFLVFCIDEKLKTKIKEEMEQVFTPVTFNLKGNFWINQHAAFSDFHGTSGNAAGNTSFTDANFVNRRFVWVGHREML
jgi:phenylacetic acid degradation protein paaN